jgi:hypothetical protein
MTKRAFPPPNSSREHAAKVFIHNFECAAQQISRFCVNFANGIFQGGHGFRQVGGLSV